MNFTDYYRLTKLTLISRLKISGAIFTSICFIITLLAGTANHTLADCAIFFLKCVLIGNGVGVFILIIALLKGYFKAKDIFNLLNSIPKQIRDELNLDLTRKRQSSKYNFLEMFIYCDTYELPIGIEKSIDKKTVKIVALSDYMDFTKFAKITSETEHHSPNKRLMFSGWNYSKNIELIEWQNWRKSDFETSFLELIAVTKNGSY